ITVLAATPARSITVPPDCTIEGVDASCIPELWMAPGPADELMYSWTGPNGLTGSSQFVEVFDSGTYTLTVTRLVDGAASTCSRTFTQLPENPPCAISGPDSLCGEPVQLCAPDGPYSSFIWVDSDGFYLGSDRCVTVSAAGVYTLTVFTGEC